MASSRFPRPMIQRVERWIVAQISHGTPETIGYAGRIAVVPISCPFGTMDERGLSLPPAGAVFPFKKIRREDFMNRTVTFLSIAAAFAAAAARFYVPPARFPCMGLFLSRSSPERQIFCPSSVSLFDLKARFFVPTRRFADVVARRSCQGWPPRRPCGMLRACQAIP